MSMIYNTRFNPTTNGMLHIGHVYTALVNQQEAAVSGGKFFIRFDDDQVYWNDVKKMDAKSISLKMMEDLSWLGVKANRLDSESSMIEEVDKLMRALCASKYLPMLQKVYHSDQPEMPGRGFAPYPYAPWFTARKVVMDFIEGVNLLIRGEDLVDEYSLYCYFCEAFGFPLPRQVFLPRLELGTGDISKTLGNWSIDEMRFYGDKMHASLCTPENLLHKLSISCLRYPSKGWTIDNVKQRPVWRP